MFREIADLSLLLLVVGVKVIFLDSIFLCSFVSVNVQSFLFIVITNNNTFAVLPMTQSKPGKLWRIAVAINL